MRLLVAAQGGAPQLADRLEAVGADVARTVQSVSEAGFALRSDAVDAVILEAELLAGDDLERLTAQSRACALVGWLGRASSVAVAELLEAGADEVLHAGMSEREIRARLHAAVDRGGRPNLEGPFQLGALAIDEAHGEATWDGQDLRLTRRERQVLLVLATAAGKAVRRDALYKRIWGYTMARGDRSVDVNIKRLRAKLAAVSGEVEIKTQPGVGYRLEIETEPAAVTAL